MIVSACNYQRIEIEHPESEISLVIRSFISTNNEIVVLPGLVKAQLTNVQNLNDSYNVDTIKDAIVVLTNEKGYVDTLTYNSERNEYCAENFFESENTYRLEVVKNGYPNLLSEDVMPIRVLPDSILINPFIGVTNDGVAMGGVIVYFKDLPNVENYYEIEITRGGNYGCYMSSLDPIITKEYYYPVNPDLNGFAPKRLLFTDQSLSKKQKTLNFLFNPGSTYLRGEDGGHYVIGHGVIRVNFRTVSKNYYNYQTSLLQYQFNSSGDPLFGTREPKNIFSNVENGYGVFAAYQEAFKEIYIEDIIY